jgi:hypothetical protein
VSGEPLAANTIARKYPVGQLLACDLPGFGGMPAIWFVGGGMNAEAMVYRAADELDRE